ncbi:hypothetical protein Barba3A_gp029 [Rheinheimera phage vB_RspM_Barba3A]|uniref:Uncharacterized protein n=1 Tax=Rheinheimera phage vB_RspM_Barba3A TaxID=2565687 RepID=A0A4P8MWX9_9CAUD|nr:hypothetical protein Barba3A_gp029 [Rheinheimera phage vB_RspM_Barba3A]
MSTQIFNVDFRTKKVISKHIGANKVEYYRCLCCGNKYSSTKEDKDFIPSVSWQIERNKQTTTCTLCKNCVSDMYEHLGGDA